MHRRSSTISAIIFVALIFVIPMLACDFSLGTARISNAVLAKDVKGDNLEPVGVTDSYSADQPEFHAIVSVSDAPTNTSLKAVWTAVDVGSVAPANTRIDQAEVTTEGTRNVHFTLRPDGDRWPSGTYKLDIYLDGKLDRSLNFVVAAPPSTPTPTQSPSPSPTSIPPTKAPPTAAVITPTLAPCPTIAGKATKLSGIVTSVTLALGAQSSTKDPVNPTVVFQPTSVIHAIVAIKNAPSNTKFAATWFANDLGAPDCNVQIDSSDLTTDGSRNLDFTLTPKTTWPSGTYRVEVYVNNALDRIVNFGVASTIEATPTSKPAATPSVAPASNLPQIPTGQGGLTIVSHYGKEINFTVNNQLYKVQANGTLNIFLPPGKYTYSANIPGTGSASGVIEIQAGRWFTQTFTE